MTLSGRSALVVVIGGIASLCLSLFLIGLLVGGVFRDHPHHGWNGQGGGAIAMQDGSKPGAGKGGIPMMSVPPEIRAELEEVLAPHQADVEKARAGMRDARMAVAKALATEPLDTDALKTALDNMQQQGAGMQQLMHDLMLEAAPKLKPDLRQRWAQRWMMPWSPPGASPPPAQ